MNTYIKDHLNAAFAFLKAFAKWAALALLIGAIGGLIGGAFYYSIAGAAKLFSAYRFLLFLLPLGGLLITFLYRVTNTEGMSTEDILMAIRDGKPVKLLLLPVIFVSTFLTHVLGGSAGREGAALQIGGSLGSNVGKWLGLDEFGVKMSVFAGMSAVFSALFGTPITATLFVLEVCSVGMIHYSALTPCAIAAFTAYFTTELLGIEGEKYAVSALAMEPLMVLRVLLLAVCCALVSILLCETMHVVGKEAKKYVKNAYLRAVVGGLLLIALTYLCGSREYNGAGGGIILRAIEEGRAHPEAFLLKLLFTAITIGFGFKGGEIVPTFFIGATFGCVVGPLLGVPAGAAAAIGMTATFCGAVNCPLASVLLSVELFGAENLPYYALACFVSYMLSGYTSLYHEQTIVYSKLNPAAK